MRLIFIIQVFSYLLRRYSFLFYRGKLKQDETKGSIKAKIKRAGWDCSYLDKVMS